MSLNAPLKRPDFPGEKVTSPSLSADGTTADSGCNSHTLQPVSSTATDSDAREDPWAQAYAALNPAVIEKYEQILLAQDAKSESGQGQRYLATFSHKQQEELWQIAQNALEDIDLVEWKEHINIDEFNKVVTMLSGFLGSTRLAQRVRGFYLEKYDPTCFDDNCPT